MKRIKGHAYGIHNFAVGIVTKGRRLLFRSNYIRVDQDSPSSYSGYACSVVSGDVRKKDGPVLVCQKNDLQGLHEGDIAMVTSDGDLTVLYENGSRHNVLFVTERCNHRCIMCPQPPVIVEEDKIPIIRKLVSLLPLNLETLGVTGGEPTVLEDGLFVLLGDIANRLPLTIVNVLSNGSRFADMEFAKRLFENDVDNLHFEIPLYSDLPGIHNKMVGNSSFYLTAQGIHNLIELGISVGIRNVITAINYDRIPQYAEFIYRNFPYVSQVSFVQMETTGLARNNIERLWIDPYVYMSAMEEAVMYLAGHGLNPLLLNSQLCIVPDSLLPYYVKSISEWKNIYLEECSDCKLRHKCGGFFESNRMYHSKHIHRL